MLTRSVSLKRTVFSSFLSSRPFVSRSQAAKMNRNCNPTVLSVAAGVGLIAGTTGIIMYHYLVRKRYLIVPEQDVNRLHRSLENLKLEFEEFKENMKYEFEELKNPRQRHGRSRRSRRNYNPTSTSSAISVTDASMYSAMESDLDDEFCDLSNSDEEGGLDLSLASFSSYQTAMSSVSQTNGELSSVDKLLEGTDEDKAKAKELLLGLETKDPTDVEVLWRLAKVSHALGSIAGAKGDSSKKKEMIAEGVVYGERALASNENNANAHKWYAICVGARGQFSSTKEKIQDGVKFKEHIQKAIAIDSSDPTLHNLLARFEFEVSSLSSMERRVASWLFAEVPNGTIENAIAGFTKTEELNPKPWKENRLLLAKCYIAQKDYETAVKWLDKALEVPAVNSEEKNFDEEIKKLLKKYESYRKS